MKGANGVSITVTIGGTAVTTRRPTTAGPSQQAIASCYDA